MNHKTIRISIGIGAIIGLVGCATTTPRYPDNEVEVAVRQQEDATLARLSHSNSSDIADAAGTLARR